MKKSKVNPYDYPEKYRLPIILYKRDLELEKYYERAYVKYKKQKDDEYKNKTRTI